MQIFCIWRDTFWFLPVFFYFSNVTIKGPLQRFYTSRSLYLSSCENSLIKSSVALEMFKENSQLVIWIYNRKPMLLIVSVKFEISRCLPGRDSKRWIYVTRSSAFVAYQGAKIKGIFCCISFWPFFLKVASSKSFQHKGSVILNCCHTPWKLVCAVWSPLTPWSNVFMWYMMPILCLMRKEIHSTLLDGELWQQ